MPTAKLQPKPQTVSPKGATKPKNAVPKSFHFDRYAREIADQIAADSNLPDRDPHNDPADDLLDAKYVSLKLRCSIQWLESARCGGYSPPYVKLGRRLVRYPAANL